MIEYIFEVSMYAILLLSVIIGDTFSQSKVLDNS